MPANPAAGSANGFNNSYEYRKNRVEEAYRDVLGRDGEAERRQLLAGAMHEGRITSDDPHRQFLWSEEFYQKNGGTPRGWITALYQDQLHRDPDEGGLQYWVGVLAREGRVSVVNGFWFAEETHRARVSEAFQRLLDRSPGSGELTHWVGVARQNGITAIRGLDHGVPGVLEPRPDPVLGPLLDATVGWIDRERSGCRGTQHGARRRTR